MPALLALHTPILPMGLPAIKKEPLGCSQSDHRFCREQKERGQASPIPRYETIRI